MGLTWIILMDTGAISNAQNAIIITGVMIKMPKPRVKRGTWTKPRARTRDGSWRKKRKLGGKRRK